MSTDWRSYDDVGYANHEAELVEAYQEREASWMVEMARTYGKDVAFSYNCFPGMEAGVRALEEINAVGGLARGQSFLRLQVRPQMLNLSYARTFQYQSLRCQSIHKLLYPPCSRAWLPHRASSSPSGAACTPSSRPRPSAASPRPAASPARARTR